MKIKELGSDVEYSIPVTSTMQFGPVYNPYHHDYQDALRGFVYPTVADILKVVETGPLPKLICATRDSSITTPGDRVTKGELLLIKEVRSVSEHHHRQLHVSSLMTNTDKFLHEDCAGGFSTKPESNKLSLISIIKHVPHAFPMTVKIFPGPDLELGDHNYPTHLFEKVIKLCHTFTDVLFVASSVPENSACDSREPFEIPQEVELELQLVKLSESDHEQLCEKSKQIMRQIQGEYIKQYRSAHQDQAEYVLQDMFLKAVSSTEEEHTTLPKKVTSGENPYPNVEPIHVGILSRLGKLENMMWKMQKSQASTAVHESSKESELEPDAVGEENELKASALSQELRQQLEEQSGALDAVKTELAEQTARLELQQRQFEEELQQMTAENAALRGEVEEVRREMQQLQENPVHPGQVALLYQKELLGSPETAERNRNIVSTLTSVQVVCS